MKKLQALLPLLILTAFFVPALIYASKAVEAQKIVVVRLPLDCHQSGIQSGVPVKRLSDGRITKVDVCGAADSGNDEFRDIPYQPQCEKFDTGEICR